MGTSRYRIVVRGRLSDRLGSSLDGVGVERSPGRTVLTACGDRALVEALLERLRNLNIEVVTVNAED